MKNAISYVGLFSAWFLMGCQTSVPTGYKSIIVPNWYQWCADKPEDPYVKISIDKFVYAEDGKVEYQIQKRGYKKCSAETLEYKIVTQDVWEKTKTGEVDIKTTIGGN